MEFLRQPVADFDDPYSHDKSVAYPKDFGISWEQDPEINSG